MLHVQGYLHRRRKSKVFNCRNTSTSRNISRKSIYRDIYCMVIFFYAMFFVFPLPNQYNIGMRNKLGVVMNTFITCFLCYSLSVDIFNIIRFFSRLHIAIVFSILTTNLTSLFIRLILIMKQRRIIQTLCGLKELQHELGYRQTSICQLLKYCAYIAFASSVPAIYFTGVIRKINSPERLRVYQKDTFFGAYSDNYWISAVSLLIVDILVQQQHYFMQGFCVILCCYTFQTMNCIIICMKKKLRARNYESLEQFSEYFIKYSAKIRDCMEQMESSLSLLMTLLYGFMVWNIFSAVSFLAKYNFQEKMIFTIAVDILTLIVSITGFLILSFRASSVHDSALLLHNQVLQTVAVIASPDDPNANVLIKMAKNFSTQIAVTGSGLFTLKREIVLKIVSAVLTYGIILVQFEY